MHAAHITGENLNEVTQNGELESHLWVYSISNKHQYIGRDITGQIKAILGFRGWHSLEK